MNGADLALNRVHFYARIGQKRSLPPFHKLSKSEILASDRDRIGIHALQSRRNTRPLNKPDKDADKLRCRVYAQILRDPSRTRGGNDFAEEISRIAAS